MIQFQGKTIEPREVTIEVMYTKPIIAGLYQEINKWQDYFTIKDQGLADLAQELLDGTPFDGSEYRIKSVD